MKKELKKIILSFMICTTMFISTSIVKGEDITLKEPYIDITFDGEVKENKNHGTINLFGAPKDSIYGNNSVTYGINENGKYMKWTSDYSNGGGFNLVVDKAIGEEYTIALKFSFDNTGEGESSWKKIIDFQKTGDGITPDSGFYFYDGGKIQFYPEPANGPRIKNNQVVDLLVRRDKTTNKFEVYNRVGNDSVLAYEIVDTDLYSVLDEGLGFFHNDDYQSGETTTGGKVYSIKIWDSWSDVEEVWTFLDQERDDSINNYICTKVDGQDPTDLFPGWNGYYECQHKTNGSYIYCEDEGCNTLILDIEDWKETSGRVYITDLKKDTNPIEVNPKTGDKYYLYISVGIVSLLAIVGSIIYLNKSKK